MRPRAERIEALDPSPQPWSAPRPRPARGEGAARQRPLPLRATVFIDRKRLKALSAPGGGEGWGEVGAGRDSVPSASQARMHAAA